MRGQCIIFQVHANYLILTSNLHSFIRGSTSKRPVRVSFISVSMIPASVSDSLHPAAHQTGEDRHHHLGLDLHQVFREGVDADSDLPCHGDGIPGMMEELSHETVDTQIPTMIKSASHSWLDRGILLGIVQLLLFRELAPLYQLKVNTVGLDGVYQVQYCQARADLLVLVNTRHQITWPTRTFQNDYCFFLHC